MSGRAPQLVILAGPNGAGKSTAAPQLLHRLFGLAEFVNADVIARGLSAFAPERVAFDAGRIMLRRLRALAAARADFAFETTLATRSYAPWLRQLLSAGYETHLYFLWLPSAEAALARVRDRVHQGGHDVPEDTVRRRYIGGIRNFVTLYRSLATTWTVHDNGLETGPVEIATGGVGEIDRVIDDGKWQDFLLAGGHVDLDET